MPGYVYLYIVKAQNQSQQYIAVLLVPSFLLRSSYGADVKL